MVLFLNRGIFWPGSLFQWGVKKELSELLMLVANADTVIVPMTNVSQAMRWRQNGPARGCKCHLCCSKFFGLGALATALSQPRASWDKEARLIYFDLDTAALCIAALFANHLNTEALNIIAHVSDDFAHQRA